MNIIFKQFCYLSLNRILSEKIYVSLPLRIIFQNWNVSGGVCFYKTQWKRFFQIIYYFKKIWKIFNLIFEQKMIRDNHFFNAVHNFDLIDVLWNQEVEILILYIVFRNKITFFIKNGPAIKNKWIIIVINFKLRWLYCALLTPEL